MGTKKLHNRVGELLAEKGRRERRAISRRQVAEYLGVAKTTVDRYVRNDVERYDSATVCKFMDYFGIGPDEFFIMDNVDEAEQVSA